MSRYRVESKQREGYAVFVLKDDETDSVAELVPEIGNNLFRFDSKGRRVLEPPESLAALKRGAATKYGTPVLFPPNRVKGGKFVYNGRTYSLPLNEPPEHHLHGEISSRPWEVIQAEASDERGAVVSSRFSYASHPDLLRDFPHPLIFTLTCRLHEGRLTLSGTIANPGADEAPFAFGFHPYFRIPFASGENIVLHVPAQAEWPVSNLAFVIGRPSETELSRLINEGTAIENYPKLGCSLLELKKGGADCRIEMKESGYSIVYRFDELFPYLVLFRPDWSESFSLEPYTYVTDAFNLPFDKTETGARGIAAGATIAFATSMEIETN